MKNTRYAPVHERQEESVVHCFAVNGSARARYLRITLHNYGPLPDWHVSAGQQAWIFVDELEIWKL